MSKFSCTEPGVSSEGNYWKDCMGILGTWARKFRAEAPFRGPGRE